MTNDLTSISNDSIFNFNGHSIRIEMIDGKPYFCGIDICNAISIKNNRNVIARLKYGVHIVDVIDNLGRKQGLSYVSESNLYKIALQSRKPEAEPFVNWVCEKVLPAIRRTGCYSTAPGVDMKALGGLVKRCCRASIKEYWIDFISGKPETVTAVRQTLEWLIKSCFDSLLAEVLNNPGVDKLKTYQPLSDEDMLRCLQMWYAGRNKQTVGELQQLFEENGLLRSKLAKIRKTAAE